MADIKKHWCKFYCLGGKLAISKRINNASVSQRWLERCKCGRTNACEYDWATHKIIKHWYDQDGLLVRITGLSNNNPVASQKVIVEGRTTHKSIDNVIPQSDSLIIESDFAKVDIKDDAKGNANTD